ncbi:MAG TPA: hypothetical protein VMR50_03085 [Myxococcota bacterium]|nr:hypothetical protein [Myxococcota bacterium]
MEAGPTTDSAVRARRVLALAGLIFLAGELAAGLALDRAPLRVRFHEAADALARVRAAGPQPDVLLFGSSRFKALILPDRVESRLRETLGPGAPRVTTLAFNGGDLVGTDIMLEHVLAEGVRPRLALVELTPEWVRYPIPFLNGQLLRAFTWRDVYEWLPELMQGTRRTLVCARIFPVYCYRNELLTWMMGEPPPYLAAPRSASQSKPSPKRDDPTHGANRWARRMKGYQTSPRALHLLERVIGRCREAGIECVIVVPPISSAHRALLAGHIENTFQQALARLQRDDPTPLQDFSDRLPDDGFHDSTHGNRSGGERFSVIVADEVIAPRWKALKAE